MKRKHGLFYMLIILGFVICVPILSIRENNTAQAAELAINEVDLTLEIDHYRTLQVYGATKNVTWVSTNSKVASVSSNGRVFANASGTTTIIARSGNQKIATRVRVFQINKKSFSLGVGQTQSLIVWGANDTLSFTSSNKAVAVVDKAGKVTAVGKGTAIITAKVNDKTTESKVTVVGLNTDSIVLEYGGATGYIKTLSVENNKKKITWSTSDSSVATVNQDGDVIARGYGNATITANVDGSKLQAKVKVLQMSPQYLTLQKGNTRTIKVLGTTSKIKWESYKPSVATVDKNGKVTAHKAGKATIVANVDGRRVRAYITVTKN